jgi:hypothetical protein
MYQQFTSHFATRARLYTAAAVPSTVLYHHDFVLDDVENLLVAVAIASNQIHSLGALGSRNELGAIGTYILSIFHVLREMR